MELGPSIAVLLNPRIGLHRDMQNMVGKLNHAITLGTFNGGRVWIVDDEGTSIETTTKNGKVRELKGTWIDIHDRPMSFNARRFHKIEQHEGHMWALAAYTPQSFERCSDEVRSKLEELEFPCPDEVRSHSKQKSVFHASINTLFTAQVLCKFVHSQFHTP